MSEITVAIKGLAQQLGGLLDQVTAGLLPDAEAVAITQAIETLGRRTDAARITFAAELGKRSAPALGRDGLAWRYGCRNANALLTQATRISAREAKRRLRLGEFVTERAVFAGRLPALFPQVADQLVAGQIGVDAAEAIVTVLQPAACRIPAEELARAERCLLLSATGQITAENAGLPGSGFAFPADLIRGQAITWLAALDADGPAPAVTSPAAARSEFGFGSLKDGRYPFRGAATPELKAVISNVIDAYRGSTADTPGTVAFPSEAEQAQIDAGELTGGTDCLDSRNAAQKRADILMAVFSSTARDPKTPKMGGAAPTVLVHVNARDLIDRNGVGWIDGIEAPISITTIDRMICAGGYQKIVIGPDGQILHLGDKERFFTPAQRRAIAARDGGCVTPGCGAPPQWCEVHHVIPWREDQNTSIDNGVLLCWYHHATIDTSGWQIRMVNGAPQIKAPPWIDPTATFQPAQAHRAHQPKPNDPEPSQTNRNSDVALE